MSREAREEYRRSRNFYRDHYRLSLSVLLLVNILTLILLALIIYFYGKMPAPSYYATSSIGELIKLEPISGMEG